MNDREFESILDRCLTDVTAGQATIEEILARYPQHARRLEPFLRVAQRVMATTGPRLSDEAVNAIQGQLLRRATELKAQRRVARHRQSLFSRLVPRLRLAPVALALLLVLFGSGIWVSSAAADSLPGDAIYPVKRAAERVQMSLTFSEIGRVRLHIKFADRRLEEVQAILEQRGEFDGATLAEVGDETEAALASAEGLDEGREQALTTLATLTERQQAVLAAVQAKAPPQAQAGLNRAMERSRHGHERARAALEKRGEESQKTTPRPTHTPKPTRTPKPDHTPKPTRTPKPDHTPKPTHTPKPVHTPKPTHTPQPTHTPKPTKSHSGGKPSVTPDKPHD
ncbi:MAG: DUF5667 domain-containing protein [Chloroflexota bacterium]|nr:DUF5667 domain-containing protein [Chloroflexota bacterium]